MKIGPILAGLGAGALGSVMGGGNMMGMSPLLALLIAMKKKKQQGDGDATPAIAVNPAATQSAVARAMNPQMVPPGSAAPPFGMGQPPFGRSY